VKRSRFGLGLSAIREDEDTAMVMGVKAPQDKTKAFMISAFFPGLIGTLYFFKNGNVEPDDAFRFQMSLEILVMVMLGGRGLLFGPIFGAFAYERLRGYLITSPIFKDLHLALSGLILLLIVLFVPGGIVGWFRERFPQLRRWLE
jgi:branched-chain amino acid transport system permease protein